MSYKWISKHDRLRVLIFLVGLLGLSWCEEETVFSNSWAVEVKGGGHVADRLAEKHGFINKGLVRKTLLEFNSTVLTMIFFSRLVV